MNLNIRQSGIEIPQEARERLEKRLHFALGRMSHRVRRIQVHLADENGPRGGIDKSCTVLVKLARGGEVVIADRDADLSALLDRAVNRAGQAVLRQMSRVRDR